MFRDALDYAGFAAGRLRELDTAQRKAADVRSYQACADVAAMMVGSAVAQAPDLLKNVNRERLTQIIAAEIYSTL